MLRDPLDQYSEWLCNKCDFSLEVSVLAKMFLIRVVRICFSTIWWSFTVFVHKVPDLERKIDQMEEELNDLSAKWDDKDDDDEDEEDDAEDEDDKFLSGWFAFWELFSFAQVASIIIWVATNLLSRKDLKRLEFFIKELQGDVLHPHHCLLLIARSDIFGIYLRYISYIFEIYWGYIWARAILHPHHYLVENYQRFWKPALLYLKCSK